MKDLLTLLCILHVLVIPVDSLQCKSCLNRNGETCSSEESVECEDATGCVTVAGFTRFNSTIYPFIYKGCPIDLKSDTWLCVTSEELDWQSYVRSCDGENCNPDYYIPFDDSVDNCITCPYCYEEGNLDGCQSEAEVKCRGDNNLCLEYRGTIRKPDESKTDVSFKSCANTIAFNRFSLVYGLHEIDTKLLRLVDPLSWS